MSKDILGCYLLSVCSIQSQSTDFWLIIINVYKMQGNAGAKCIRYLIEFIFCFLQRTKWNAIERLIDFLYFSCTNSLKYENSKQQLFLVRLNSSKLFFSARFQRRNTLWFMIFSWRNNELKLKKFEIAIWSVHIRKDNTDDFFRPKPRTEKILFFIFSVNALGESSQNGINYHHLFWLMTLKFFSFLFVGFESN